MNELIKGKLTELIAICESEGESSMAGNLLAIKGAYVAGKDYELLITHHLATFLCDTLLPKLMAEKEYIQSTLN